tara:strand:+ start:23093 stop:23392 length:300 start_codon:yes stop_codon:yes gene_type:complete
MVDNDDENEVLIPGGASRYRKDLVLFNAPPPAYIPWIFIGIFFAKLLRLEVVIITTIYTVTYTFMKKRGITLNGMAVRFWVRRNSGRLNNKPKRLKYHP